MTDDVVPAATVARLPVYLRALSTLEERGQATVASTELAEMTRTTPAQLRRDLSCFGTFGTRGVGYEVANLRDALGAHVGAARVWPLVLVGAGNLGSALARQFSQPPFRVVAVVDVDPAVIGTRRGDVVVRPQHELAEAVRATGAVIGIVATPAEAAQGACDSLVDAGVSSILNFAPMRPQVPDGVALRTVDLAQELQILAFHESHRRQV